MSASVIPAPRAGFRAFVQRHDNLFTMLGALIVFVGFYYKEVKLGKLANFNSALTSAQSTLHGDLKIQDIANKVDAVSIQLTDFQANGVNDSVFHGDYKIIEEQSGIYGADQDQLSFIVQVLPNLPYKRPDLAGKADALQADIPAITGLQQKTLNWVDRAKLASATSGSRIVETPDYKTLMGYANQFVPGVASFDSQVHPLEQQVDKAITDQLAQVNDESARASRISDCLFVAGWLLGLMGKILKIPALSGG
jgi:hypothetical protein